jgi:peptide/nickel transport system permease protein
VIIILVLSLAAVFAPLISPTDPLHMDFDALMQSPSRDHPAGTDSLGRDNLSRIIWGGRVSLQVGVLSMAIATVIGVSAGLAAGYYGRWIDTIIMRIVDAILAFPALLLAILMVAVLGPSLRNAMLAIAVAFIPSFARVTRANTLSIREKEYVEGARAIGASAVRIMLRTILPNTLSTVIVQVSLGMSYAILIEAGLSFLGLGIQPPTPSWGYMLATGREFITLAWWLTTFPGLAIFVTVLSWNFIGDGLREALDPRQQRR